VIKVTAVPKVSFVGLWDTVDAYGMPIEEFKVGIDRYLWPIALKDKFMDPRIDNACHALSLDDQRLTFHPLLWDEYTFAQKKLPTRPMTRPSLKCGLPEPTQMSAEDIRTTIYHTSL
jgi:hypothetical protein